MRLYYEELGKHPASTAAFAGDHPLASGKYCPVPTGVLAAPREIILAPRSWMEMTFNVRHWAAPPRGGHFFALEQPELMAAEVAHFFQEVLDFDECVRMAPAPGTARPWALGAGSVLAAAAAAVAMAVHSML
jgi:hypothetical protein